MEFPYGIAYLALKELHEYFIPVGAITKAGLMEMLCQVSKKGDQCSKDLECELIRIISIFIEI